MTDKEMNSYLLAGFLLMGIVLSVVGGVMNHVSDSRVAAYKASAQYQEAHRAPVQSHVEGK